MAQHDRARIADKGWRLPRALRTSGMSEKTSMSGRGGGIMKVGFPARVLDHEGVPGKQGPMWNKTLELVWGLIGNLFPKTEWPWGEVLPLDRSLLMGGFPNRFRCMISSSGCSSIGTSLDSL